VRRPAWPRRFDPHVAHLLTSTELHRWRAASVAWFGGATLVAVAIGFLLVTDTDAWAWAIVAGGWAASLGVAVQGNLLGRARRRLLARLETRATESEARWRRFTGDRTDD
jgi:hypothetical protein